MRIEVSGLTLIVTAGLFVLAPPGTSGGFADPLALADSNAQEQAPRAAGPAERLLRVGETIEGEVTAAGEVVHTPVLDGRSAGAPVHGVRIALEVGSEGPVTIDLRSYSFDTYLVLESADGEMIAEDDDGLILTHSRIVASLQPGRYSVIACALHGDTGTWVLEARAEQATPLEGPQRSVAEIEDLRKAVESREASDPTGVGLVWALNALAVRLASQNRFGEAEPLWRRALEVGESRLGDSHPDITVMMGNLAFLYQNQGRYAEAEPLYARALEIQQNVLGDFHPDIAGLQTALAELLELQGRYAEAEPLYVRALEIREAVLGDSHPDTAASFVNLGDLYRLQGRYAEAEPLLVRGKELCDSGGDSHPHIASALNNLAVLYHSQGRYAEEEALLERALEISESRLGASHPTTVVLLNNLAESHDALGRHGEAERLLVRVLEIREAVLGATHPDTAMSLNNLAGLYDAQGRHGEAEPLFVRALEIYEATLGATHPDTARSLINLANQHLAQGRYAKAESLYARGLEIAESQLGGSHPETARALNAVAQSYEAQGRHAEAESLYVRALNIRESVLGDAHPDTANSLSNLAFLYQSQGRFDDAEPLYVRALEIVEPQPGGAHAFAAVVLSNLASLHASQGQYGDAEPLLARALEIRRSELGASHPSVALSLNNLAALYGSQGLDGEAEPLYVHALEIAELQLGEAHPDTHSLRDNFARLRSSQGRFPEALALRLRSLDGRQSWVESELLLAASDRRLSIAATQTTAVEHALRDWFAQEDPKLPFDRVYRRICAWKGVALRNTARVSRVIHEAVANDPVLRTLRTDLLDLEGQLSVLAYAERIEDAAAHMKNIAELRERRNRLQQEMQARLGLDPERRSTDGAELASVLPEGGAVLDFLTHRRYVPRVVEDSAVIREETWTDPRMLCVVTASGAKEPVLVDLGDATRLREATDEWLDQMVPGRRGASAAAIAGPPPGEAVRELLFDPILAVLPADTTRLFVIPDDFLGAVPFGAVPFGEEQYLIDAVDVLYATDPVSLRDLLESTPDPTEGAPSVLAVGGVDYDKRGDEPDGIDPRSLARAELRAGPTSFARRWDPLASTPEEVEGLAARAKRTWLDAEPPLVLRGNAATEDAVKSLVAGRTILHFATHGFFQREGMKSIWEAALDRAHEPAAPKGLGMLMGASDRRGSTDAFAAGMPALEGEAPGMLAGLILAGANLDPSRDPDRDDGVLTATEVSSLDLSACQVAVLSACQTSLGLRRTGEGLQSLRRAFHEAGARSVVASLWKVDDVATQRLMHAFYEELWTNGHGPGEALRRAKQALKREGLGPEAWGAFTLSGEWR